jgi:hypothetical protein
MVNAVVVVLLLFEIAGCLSLDEKIREEFREGVDKNNLINSVPYFD